MDDLDLVVIMHPRSGEYFKVNRLALDGHDNDLIPLFEMNGERRSRADAWLGSGRPSDIQRVDARNSVVK